MFKRSYLSRSRSRPSANSEDGTICNNSLRSKPYITILSQGAAPEILVGDLDLLLITIVLGKTLRQLKT